MAHLGFIGLGVMGSRMVKRLLDAGHTVTGYNRTRSKAQWLLDQGMQWGETPATVARSGDIVLSMVANTVALQALTGGADGVLAGLRPGAIFVDMSTVSPTVSRALAAQVATKGAHMLDAPVSGSVITLEEGRLSLMVGGDRGAFERALPILQDIGPKVTYVGANGLAASMKIATNLSLAVQMLAFSEGVLLAEKSGIARETAVEVLLNSVIASPMVWSKRVTSVSAWIYCPRARSRCLPMSRKCSLNSSKFFFSPNNSCSIRRVSWAIFKPRKPMEIACR